MIVIRYFVYGFITRLKSILSEKGRNHEWILNPAVDDNDETIPARASDPESKGTVQGKLDHINYMNICY